MGKKRKQKVLNSTALLFEIEKMGFFNSFDKKDGGIKGSRQNMNLPPPPVPRSNKYALRDNLPPPPTTPVQPASANIPPSMVAPPATPSPVPFQNTSPAEKQNIAISVSTQQSWQKPVQKSFERPEKKRYMDVPDTLPSLNLPMIDGTREDSFEEEEIPFFDNSEIKSSAGVDSLPLPLLEIEEVKSAPAYKEKKPLYIRSDRYRQILTNIDIMNNYVKESPDMIYVLKNLKRNADIENKNYVKLMEDIQRKLIYVDNVLFQSIKGEPI